MNVGILWFYLDLASSATRLRVSRLLWYLLGLECYAAFVIVPFVCLLGFLSRSSFHHIGLLWKDFLFWKSLVLDLCHNLCDIHRFGRFGTL